MTKLSNPFEQVATSSTSYPPVFGTLLPGKLPTSTSPAAPLSQNGPSRTTSPSSAFTTQVGEKGTLGHATEGAEDPSFAPQPLELWRSTAKTTLLSQNGHGAALTTSPPSPSFPTTVDPSGLEVALPAPVVTPPPVPARIWRSSYPR